MGERGEGGGGDGGGGEGGCVGWPYLMKAASK